MAYVNLIAYTQPLHLHLHLPLFYTFRPSLLTTTTLSAT